MAKKKLRKEKNGSKVGAGKPKGKGENAAEPDSEGKMDYGGMPNVDFKKNLGCG